MDAGLGVRIALHADRLARAFAGAGVGLGALAAHRQAAQVADAAIALDALQALEVHADLAAQIAFDDILAVLDRVDDLGELLLGQILGADARIDVGLGQDLFALVGPMP